MSVNASITSCSSQVLAFSVGDMLTIRVLETLCETEIDDEDSVFIGFVNAN